MPQAILLALVLVVGPYMLLVGAASFGFMAARGREDSSAPREWPTVSILVDSPLNSANDLPKSILDSSYPEDRIEEIIQVRPDSSEVNPFPNGSNVRERSVQPAGPTSAEARPDAGLRRGLETARGEVVLATTADCEVPPDWIPSMVRRCSPTTPVVFGPILVEHDDRFLPRLEALYQVGAFAFAAGLQHVGLQMHSPASNLAVRPTDLDDPQTDDEVTLFCEASLDGRLAFNPDAEAAVSRSAACSLVELLRRQVRLARRMGQHGSWKQQTVSVGFWLTHALLLVCCLAAGAVPAWRQPTLLILLGKMGADALLSVPSARHFGQGTLSRSIVPCELMLLITIPIAGPWSLTDFSAETNLRAGKPQRDA